MNLTTSILLISYIISVLISYFLFRRSAIKDRNTLAMTDDNLICIIIVMIIPFLNIAIPLFDYVSDMNIEKFFRIK